MEKNNQAILDMIARYKVHVREHGLDDELYKWILIERFKGRPDISKPDLEAEIAEVRFGNLLYQMAASVMKHLAAARTDGYRACLAALFDEATPITERMLNFYKDTLALYREIVPEERYGHHHDERTASILLAFHAPDRYPIYKDSFYRKLCKDLGIKHKKVGEKYAHYQQLVQGLVQEYILPDEELQSMMRERLPADAYPDPNHLLLAQNILYVVLDHNEDADVNYWLFQCDPSVYDIQKGLSEGLIDQWTVTAHKDEIKSGDKVILWVVGEDAGCYALADVKSSPGPRKPAADDHYWTQTDPSDTTVDIEITHNFADDPVYWIVLKNEPEFAEMARGLRGTNFASTKNTYDAILRFSKPTALDGRTFWLLAPGRGASEWDQFQLRGVAGIGWPELGNLSTFSEREELRNHIREVYQQEGTKKNDTNACWEFAKEIKIGDIIIAKRSTNAYLGWGIVESKYYYDETFAEYPNLRKVNWMKVGVWPEEKLVSKTLTNISKYPQYVQRLIKLLDIDLQSKTISAPMQSFKFPLNQILYGPPGTGKTYHTLNRALEILGITTTDRREMKRLFEEKVNAGQIAFVTFHQSMSYEDFVEGIKPNLKEDEGDLGLSYHIKPGIFKSISEKADQRKGNFSETLEALKLEISEADGKPPLTVKAQFSTFDVKFRGGNMFYIRPHNSAKQDAWYPVSIPNIEKYFDSGSLEGIYNSTYVKGILDHLIKTRGLMKGKAQSEALPHILIIDEINRGNVSQIFGELITLIEEDKRAGMPEALSVTLPYSKDSFSVPPNLYLIGTMNTADRSVEALDTALRRRFEFIEMAPKPGLVPATLADAPDVSPRDILHTINLRIEKLLDRDHQIGHAYFMEITQLAALKHAFQHKLMPLLQEYFFGDYSKIGLVLGKGFVHKVAAQHSRAEDIFANFDSEYKSDLAQRDVWHLCNFETMDFKAALGDLKAVAFTPAT